MGGLKVCLDWRPPPAVAKVPRLPPTRTRAHEYRFDTPQYRFDHTAAMFSRCMRAPIRIGRLQAFLQDDLRTAKPDRPTPCYHTADRRTACARRADRSGRRHAGCRYQAGLERARRLVAMQVAQGYGTVYFLRGSCFRRFSGTLVLCAGAWPWRYFVTSRLGARMSQASISTCLSSCVPILPRRISTAG